MFKYKKYGLFCLLLLLSSQSFSQNKFNKRYDIDKGAEAFGVLIRSNNNFFMLGRFLDSMIYYTTPPPKARIAILKINNNGTEY